MSNTILPYLTSIIKFLNYIFWSCWGKAQFNCIGCLSCQATICRNPLGWHEAPTSYHEQHGLILRAELLFDDSFRMKWKTSASMRKAFFSDVGISALNLVHLVGLCHNDTRPANIMVKDDSFCLIDFDMSHTFVVNQKHSVVFSPQIISSGWVDTEKMMFFAVAQIAVTVFILSANKKYTLEKVSKS